VSHFDRRRPLSFRGRRFSEADPPELMDREGAEFVLVGASEDIEDELGVKLKPKNESEASADMFKDLRIDKSKRTTKPLLEGEWE
jgi:hypothetical protein